MTPAEARAAMAVVRDDTPEELEDEVELSPLERRYCHEFVFGPHAGIQMRAYQDASGLGELDSCSWQSSAMMKLTRVTRYIRQLQKELRVQRAATYLEGKKTWHELAELGMGVIEDAILGLPVTGKQLEAAVYSINRDLGLPTANVDIVVMNRERIVSATKAFQSRLAKEEDSQKRLSPGGLEEVGLVGATQFVGDSVGDPE